MSIRIVRPLRGGLVVGGLMIAPIPSASAQFTERDFINVTGFGNVATETNYVPNVVQAENGLGSFEALKAQAVAARTFAYFQMDAKGFINDGTDDQVYSDGNPPGSIHLAAAAATENEVLWVRDNIGFQQDVLIASFYVAGAIPTGSVNVDNPGVIVDPGDFDPTSTEQWVTYTFANGDSGGNNLGTPLGFQGTPSNPNWPNRGAKSQNGADYLSDNSVNYLDILKYYYGADIQVRTVDSGGAGLQLGPKVLTDFDNYGSGRASDGIIEGHEGVFNRSPTFSGSTSASLAGSTAERTAAEAFSGTHSQLIDIVYDESIGGDYLLRHVAGAKYSDFGGRGIPLNKAADRTANVQFENLGSVGFWLKTDDPGLQVSLAIDDPNTGDRGILRDVIADNQWHKYEWFLEEDSFWENWAGGDGTITGDTVTIDSIQFLGNTDAQVYLDEIFWDSQAVFQFLAGDYNFDGFVSQPDLDLVLLNWGDGILPPGFSEGALAGGTFDGLISQNELDGVLLNWGDGTPPSITAIPEPGTLGALAGIAMLTLRRRR